MELRMGKKEAGSWVDYNKKTEPRGYCDMENRSKRWERKEVTYLL